MVLTPAPADLEFLKRYEKQLPMLFIVSEVELDYGSARSAATPEEGRPGIAIQPANGVKCLRCWRYVPSVSKDPAWEGLCDRCQDALAETVNG